MSIERWSKPIFVSFLLAIVGIRITDGASGGDTLLVKNVDTVPTSMSSWQALWLSVEAHHPKVAILSLTWSIVIETAGAHWNSALDSSMDTSVGSKAWSLVRENLVGSQLLLIQCLLLVLKSFDLLLESNLGAC